MKSILSLFLVFILADSAFSQKKQIITWGGNSNKCKTYSIINQSVKSIYATGNGFAILEDNTIAHWGKRQEIFNLQEVDSVSKIREGVIIKTNGTVVNGYGTIDTSISNVKDIVKVTGDYASLVLFRDSTTKVYSEDTAYLNKAPIETKVKQIEAGYDYMLALLADGTVRAWGRNIKIINNIPSYLKDVVKICAGTSQAVALKSDGTMVTWGDGNYPFSSFPNNKKITNVSVYKRDIMFLYEDGTISGDFGYELGPNRVDSLLANRIKNIVDIAMGEDFALALDTKGKVFGLVGAYIGINVHGASVPNGYDNLVSIAAGDFFIAGLKENGKIVTTGYDAYGYFAPLIPSSLSNVKAISAGSHHILALKEDGTVEAFIAQNFTSTINKVPTGLSRVKAIVAKDNFSVALKHDGHVVTWGAITYVPEGLDNVIDIAGSDYNNIIGALKKDGTIVLWGEGSNFYEIKTTNAVQLFGSNDKIWYKTDDGILRPTTTGGYYLNGKDEERLVAVAGGNFHGLGLKRDASVLSWGDPYYGGTVPNGLKNALDIKASYYFSMALVGVSSKIPVTNYVKGGVYHNAKNTCGLDSTKQPIAYRILKGHPGNFYANTDSLGQYRIAVDTSTKQYSITQVLNKYEKQYIENTCGDSRTINLTDAKGDTCCVDFSNTNKSCSFLSISVESKRNRKCFRGETVVKYTNSGNSDAKDVTITVKLPEYVEAVSSSPSWFSKQGKTVFYKVNTISPGVTNQIRITDSVACVSSNLNGITQCVSARIDPPNQCFSPSVLWDSSRISVSGICEKGIAKFQLINTGKAMENASEYRVYINDTLVKTTKFTLTSSALLPVNVTAMGKAIRLEADQSSYFPANSKPRMVIEGCVSDTTLYKEFKTGFVTSNTLDNGDPYFAISCVPIISSYDPNDKLVTPTGKGQNHLINAGEEFQYTIRFQNTGNDTAFRVVIVDTLDENLDLETFLEGASSHNYVLKVTGKTKPILTFAFYNILLPDSGTNNLGSQGFVQYKISSYPAISEGTKIKNNASIFFDFNDPVITNTTFHTISNDEWVDDTKEGLVNEESVMALSVEKYSNSTHLVLYPNPTQGEVFLSKVAPWLLTNILGEELQKGEGIKIDLNKVEKGIYFVSTGGQMFKVIKQ